MSSPLSPPPSSPASPARLAVIGHPVAHSRSPAIHARFAAACGDAVDYRPLLAPLDGFLATAEGLAGAGALGANVTVPFKAEAFAACDRLTDRARLAGAVNTLRFDGPRGGAPGWLGDNTDGAGLVRDITVNAGVSLAGATVLVLGAGGAAAGSLGPLIEAGPARLVVVNRTAARADALVARLAPLAAARGVALAAAPMAAPGAAFDVVVNATAASLQGDLPPLPSGTLRAGGLGLDMMYGPAARPFLQWVRAQGATARDGLGMLVEQAAEAYTLWLGHRPPTADTLAALRAELDAAAPAEDAA